MEELIAVVGLGLGASLGLGLVRAATQAVAGVRAPRRAGLPRRAEDAPRSARVALAYTHTSRGRTWYLHARAPAAPGRRKRRVFYFARQPRPGEAVAEVPAGYEITENRRTGMPLLRRSAASARA